MHDRPTLRTAAPMPLREGAGIDPTEGQESDIATGLANRLFSLSSPGGRNAKLTILLFHKTPRSADPLTPGEPLLSQFEFILDYLQDQARVLPLRDAIAGLAKGSLPRKAVAITFDDGYDDWLETVSPALRRRGMPATFFVTTEQLSGPGLWHERIVAAVRSLPDRGATLPYGFSHYADLQSTERRIQLVKELTERMKYAPLPERLGAVEMLEAQARTMLRPAPPFDSNAVRELHSQGFEIGGHTISHPILNECSDAQALSEIGGCKEELESIIGGRVDSFAYPNGRPVQDYAGRHVAMVKACGYKVAVATSNGAANRHSDLFQLPRFSPWATTRVRLAAQLTRNALEREVTVHLPERDAAPASTPVRCLLIASTFAPIHGGSAVVYESLCQHMPAGSIRVLTAKRNYVGGKEIEGWQEHDRQASFPIDRIDLLRPQIKATPPANFFMSLGRFVFEDLPLYARALWKAAYIVHRQRINVVCVGELITGTWLGIALRKLFGTRLIIYVHGEEITTQTGGRLHGNKRRDYLHAADKVVAVSSFTCDAMTHDMQIRSDRVMLIPNGVDVERFTPGPKSQALIERHGLQGKQVVLTLGRLVRRKGADMAIRAMARILKTHPHVHYLIVGQGELQAELEAIIAQENMGAQITLVGKVSEPELVEYFRLCDLFLMPNRTLPDGDTEGFGLVFREANACGKPVIGGRAGGVVEAVLHGTSGLLVNGEDLDDIEAALRSLLDDPARAADLGGRGLALANATSTASMADQFRLTCERTLRSAR